MKIIGKGAEATVYEDKGQVIKKRLQKTYRLKEIDDRLRGSRTRREEKVLSRLEKLGFPAPRVIESDSHSTIKMEKIEGEKVRQALTKDNAPAICRTIGSMIRIMHDAGIIHGDLTTSNMIRQEDGTIVFIDFGLSFFSTKEEDKAVDLHLMKQALDSSHYAIATEGFAAVKESYGDPQVERRLMQVEQRGRNKGRH